jgi:HD superfamily phosphohydrolase
MEVRDPVHGSIHILDEEIPIIRHEFFQRLRNIKQLGLSEYVFPGATHSRFIHSIGVMDVGNRAFNKLFGDKVHSAPYQRLRETLKLGCLLHDIGHAPLSHSTESAMPQLSELKIPERFLSEVDKKTDRQATHEDYTIKAIVDSSFTKSFKDVENNYGVDKNCVADLIVGYCADPDYFTIDGINYFGLLSQLVSSELDCDRMDYLLRDSYFCGVSYGSYDLDWLLDNLDIAVIDGEATLGISERAVITFDDFLLSRYHMFVMVYFHYRSVCLEQLLLRYFEDAPGEYKIPANIEEYIEHDDHFLMKVLRKSNNRYANAIVKNRIPEKIFESFNRDQHRKLNEIQAYLVNNNIEHIRCSSSGRLSKYYTQDLVPEEVYTMKVVRKLKGSKEYTYTPINSATDLYAKYSASHSVNRLHCDMDSLSDEHKTKIQELILA